jgi:predicted 3-demethylubiquinone-9 3-methyltransferase (glyoxalase superfamily)
MDRVLGELHLTHVEVPYTADLIAWVNDRWSLTLSLREDHVNEVLCAQDRMNTFEIV